MKRKFEEVAQDEYHSNTALTKAIEDYNLILEGINSLKIYQKPQQENGIDYQIEEDKKEAFEALESQRLLALNTIRALLAQGQDPNSPKLVNIYGNYRDERHVLMPLHLSIDKDLIDLLMQYQANPSDTYGAKVHSPLRWAHMQLDFFKIYTLVAYRPLKIAQSKINACANKVITQELTTELALGNDYLDLRSLNYREKARNLLISQMNSKALSLQLIDKAMLCKINPDVMELDKLDGLIYQLKHRYFQLSFSPFVWFILREAFEFQNFPKELVGLIMVSFHFSLTNDEQVNKPYQRYLAEKKAKEEEVQLFKSNLKLRAFKILYTLLIETKSSMLTVEPLDFEGLTLNILEEKKKMGDPLIIKAWELMSEHYDDLSQSNYPLIKTLLQWAADNDTHYAILCGFSFFSSRHESYGENLMHKVRHRFEELVTEPRALASGYVTSTF